VKIPRNKQANHAVGFINSLTHTGDWSGKPFKLRKFQEDFTVLGVGPGKKILLFILL